MTAFIKKHLITLIGISVGAIAGFFYWKWVGCNSGTCAITSSPTNSTIYGALMGGLGFNIFQKDKPKTQDENAG